MSESKYSPQVNMPENAPDRPESLTVMFLRNGQYVAVSGADLMLYQLPGEANSIGLGVQNGERFQAFIIFPGKLGTIAEKKVVLSE